MPYMKSWQKKPLINVCDNVFMADHEWVQEKNRKSNHWLLYDLMSYKFCFTNLEAQVKE